MKADRALRDLRAAARGKLSEGFVPGGNALMRELPGKGPWGYFDPIGITPECQREALLWREAEIMHGDVAMVAALGFFVQEALFHPLIPDVPDNLAINQLKDTPMPLAVLLVGSIFFTEITRARKGWVEPDFSSRTAQANTVRVLREGYEPGDFRIRPAQDEERGDAGEGAQQWPPRDDRGCRLRRPGARDGCARLRLLIYLEAFVVSRPCEWRSFVRYDGLCL